MIALRDAFKNVATGRSPGWRDEAWGFADRRLPMPMAQWRSACPSSLTVAGAAPALAHGFIHAGRTGFPFQFRARLRTQYQKQC